MLAFLYLMCLRGGHLFRMWSRRYKQVDIHLILKACAGYHWWSKDYMIDTFVCDGIWVGYEWKISSYFVILFIYNHMISRPENWQEKMISDMKSHLDAVITFRILGIIIVVNYAGNYHGNAWFKPGFDFSILTYYDKCAIVNFMQQPLSSKGIYFF